MKSLHYLIACLFLISTNMVLANVMFPMFEAILKSGSGSLLVPLIAFLLEYTCICILIQAHALVNFRNAFVCTLVMNLLSSLLGGIFGLPVYGLVLWMWSFTAHSKNVLIANMAVTDVIAGFFMLFGYSIVNMLIEVWIPLNLAWFDDIPRKRIWFWVFVANFLSTSVYFCALLYKLSTHTAWPAGDPTMG
jgi:hypothetical protein